MIPKDIEKWDNIRWEKELAYCKPSSGGAVGVVFAWVGGAGSRRSGYVGSLAESHKPETASFVIKPIQGTAAPTKFAEHVLSKIAGTHSPNSRSISRRSYSGTGLVMMLKSFRSMEKDSRVKARWNEVFSNYNMAETFLIQEMQTGMRELSEYHEDENILRDFLTNQKLMRNLGKLFAADALIGNGDRLFSLNTGNIIFKEDGRLCAIDSAAILSGYSETVAQNTEAFNRHVATVKPEQRREKAFGFFASSHIHSPGIALLSPYSEKLMKIQNSYMDKGMQVPPEKRVQIVQPLSFSMKQIFSIDGWWNSIFKHKLASKAKNVSKEDWESALKEFKKGFEDGRKEIDRKLNWGSFKWKYKKLAKQYGSDPNLDWDNLMLRREYFKLVKKGDDMETALTKISELAKKNLK